MSQLSWPTLGISQQYGFSPMTPCSLQSNYSYTTTTQLKFSKFWGSSRPPILYKACTQSVQNSFQLSLNNQNRSKHSRVMLAQRSRLVSYKFALQHALSFTTVPWLCHRRLIHVAPDMLPPIPYFSICRPTFWS